LSVVREELAPGHSEVRHRHRKARQVFHVLSGVLTLEVDGVRHAMSADEALEVAPGAVHQARNDGKEITEFLVISAPTTRGDRIEEGA
jgi:mannose-6-phosphate isomerase-like protein (cupin superfamily)